MCPEQQHKIIYFLLAITGRAEEKGITDFLRQISQTNYCVFKTIGRIPQLNPIKKKNIKKIHGKKVDDKATAIGFRFQRYIEKYKSRGRLICMIIDDLEYDRKDNINMVINRYKLAFDVLPDKIQKNSAVHFLKYMLEAYFLADAKALSEVTGTDFKSHKDDVELIRNPKNEIKKKFKSYSETKHAPEICKKVDLDTILENPEHCASLRSLFKGLVCNLPKNETTTKLYNRFCLEKGNLLDITASQIPCKFTQSNRLVSIE